MSNVPTILICTDAAVVDVRLVWGAMGQGWDTFGRKLCSSATEATPETPPTHWLMSDAGSQSDMVTAWQAMANGDLPQIDGVWGENGIISAAAAMAATNGANLHVYTVSGDVQPEDFLLGMADANHVRHGGMLASEGLQFVPEGDA